MYILNLTHIIEKYNKNLIFLLYNLFDYKNCNIKAVNIFLIYFSAVFSLFRNIFYGNISSSAYN